MAEDKKQANENKQPWFVEVVCDTAFGAICGAIGGVTFDFFAKHVLNFQSFVPDPVALSSLGPYRPLCSIVTATRLEHVRNLAVVYGVKTGMSCAMKKLTGDGPHTSVVADFGSGVMLSMVTGMRGPEVVTVGVIWALLGAAYEKVSTQPSQPKAQDVLHDDHEMNFNTGLFTNNALSRLNDRRYCFCVCGKETKKGGRSL